jgi:hypothetical protein
MIPTIVWLSWWRHTNAPPYQQFKLRCSQESHTQITILSKIVCDIYDGSVQALPTNNRPIRIAIAKSVGPAFLVSGGLKAGTPLLIASIPVSAVQPLEKAYNINGKVSGCVAGGAKACSDLGPSVRRITPP